MLYDRSSPGTIAFINEYKKLILLFLSALASALTTCCWKLACLSFQNLTAMAPPPSQDEALSRYSASGEAPR